MKASSIPPQGARFACPKCQHRFRVRHKSFPLSPGSTDHGRIENSKFAKTPLAGDTKDTGLPGAPVSHQARSAGVKLCPYCGLFMGESAERCIHCGGDEKISPMKAAALARLSSSPEEEESHYRRKVRYTFELAVAVVLAVVLVALNMPSSLPEGLKSSPVRDLIRVESDDDYGAWTEKYKQHIAGRSPYILNDMKILDRAKFRTPYVRRFKKEYLEYVFTTAEYRYSPYTPQQRIVAENPAQFAEVQIQNFEVGPRYVGPVDLSVFNKSSFPLYDLGINLVYKATKGPNRGRKTSGFLLVREPVGPGKLKIYMNLHHLQPVPSFEGLDEVSFYVTSVKVGKGS
ncbi:MAG: hypothetical protein JRG73_01215 [Deltaproteobacteria bacterium]|nr:hypothetical protein [Deltaproteobacteria bacterium]